MISSPSDSTPFVSSGGELALSNAAQLELMRGVLEKGLPFHMTARGLSMRPFVRDGDAVTVAPLDTDGPSVGDIVAVVLPATERLAIHRVIARDREGWMVRGDNALQSDGTVRREHILGRVVKVERGGRDVRIGVGRAGNIVAALSRSGALQFAGRVATAPRRSAAAVLQVAQTVPIYRTIAREVAPSFAVVDATEKDMEFVQRHLNPAGPYGPVEPDPSVTNLVARRKAKVIGFAQLVRHAQSDSAWAGYWLFSLQVWSLCRGQGVGRALTQRVIELACREGAPELLLAVFEDNDRAIRLYRKLGFEATVIEALELDFEVELRRDGRRRLVMRKPLS
jgi:ribosomal protein S18 acetylase RimI-like enzyme